MFFKLIGVGILLMLLVRFVGSVYGSIVFGKEMDMILYTLYYIIPMVWVGFALKKSFKGEK